MERLEIYLGDFSNCHNKGAPFETFSFCPRETYQSGYDRGFSMGFDRKQYYTAGGPWVYGRSNNRSCVHIQRYEDLSELNNKLWCRGWKHGQQDARNNSYGKRLVFEAVDADLRPQIQVSYMELESGKKSNAPFVGKPYVKLIYKNGVLSGAENHLWR